MFWMPEQWKYSFVPAMNTESLVITKAKERFDLIRISGSDILGFVHETVKQESYVWPASALLPFLL